MTQYPETDISIKIPRTPRGNKRAAGEKKPRDYRLYGIRAAAVGTVAAVLAGGLYWNHEAQERDDANATKTRMQAQRLSEARSKTLAMEKLVADGKNAAAATIEQQRLNPKSVRALGSLLIIPSGTTLSASPLFVGKPGAPGNTIVPPQKITAVLNPVRVGNTYQFNQSCEPVSNTGFVPSSQLTATTLWVGVNTVPAVSPIPSESMYIPSAFNQNSGQLHNSNNMPIDCATSLDPAALQLVERLSGIRPAHK